MRRVYEAVESMLAEGLPVMQLTIQQQLKQLEEEEGTVLLITSIQKIQDHKEDDNYTVISGYQLRSLWTWQVGISFVVVVVLSIVVNDLFISLFLGIHLHSCV